MPKFDDRFARQNRYKLPSEFPLTSPYSGIVHHLSGPNRYALTQIFQRISRSVDDTPKVSPFTFIPPQWFDTLRLAHMLDSLVRVSRRVKKNHLVTVDVSEKCSSHLSPSLRECLGPKPKNRKHCNLTRKIQSEDEFC